MDPILAAVIILALTNAASEILPFTPLAGNGLLHMLLEFIKKAATSKLPEDSAR